MTAYWDERADVCKFPPKRTFLCSLVAIHFPDLFGLRRHIGTLFRSATSGIVSSCGHVLLRALSSHWNGTGPLIRSTLLLCVCKVVSPILGSPRAGRTAYAKLNCKRMGYCFQYGTDVDICNHVHTIVGDIVVKIRQCYYSFVRDVHIQYLLVTRSRTRGTESYYGFPEFDCDFPVSVVCPLLTFD